MKVSYIKVAGQPDKKIESTHKASLLIKEKGASADDKGVWVSLGEVKLHPEHETCKLKMVTSGLLSKRCRTNYGC